MKKRILALLLVLVLAFTFTACSTGGAEQEIAQAQSALVQQANDAVGMPDITKFSERKLARDILELRDDADLVTYAYAKNDMGGKFVYLGRSIGFGLPYSVQYTNPMAAQWLKVEYSPGVWSEGSNYLVPQADPNGLYMPEGLAATWIVMVDETTGERYIMYFESDLTVAQNKLPRRICEDWSLPLDY